MEQLDHMTFEEWTASIHRDEIDSVENYHENHRPNPFSITDYIKSFQSGRKDGKQRNDGN